MKISNPTIQGEQGYEYHEVSEAFTLMSSDFYIAISLGTLVTVVDQWQSTLEAMQQDGTYDAIHRKWFPEKITNPANQPARHIRQ